MFRVPVDHPLFSKAYPHGHRSCLWLLASRESDPQKRKTTNNNDHMGIRLIKPYTWCWHLCVCQPVGFLILIVSKKFPNLVIFNQSQWPSLKPWMFTLIVCSVCLCSMETYQQPLCKSYADVRSGHFGKTHCLLGRITVCFREPSNDSWCFLLKLSEFLHRLFLFSFLKETLQS